MNKKKFLKLPLFLRMKIKWVRLLPILVQELNERFQMSIQVTKSFKKEKNVIMIQFLIYPITSYDLLLGAI